MSVESIYLLGAIRTVTALNAQPKVIAKYRSFLTYAMNIGIEKGFKVRQFPELS